MGLFDNPLHVAFLVLVILLVFGPRRIPEMARSLGVGLSEFRNGLTGTIDATGVAASDQDPVVLVNVVESDGRAGGLIDSV
jgi:TatA/E family protein of Tat protein translocase